MAFLNGDRNKKQNESKRKVKQYRRVNKSGLMIFVVVLAIALLFIKDSTGRNAFQKLGAIGSSNNQVKATISRERAQNIKVLIDAGHGGFDNGATTPYVKKPESELNLLVSQALRLELENAGFKVEMTRTDSNAIGTTKDADMNKRKEIIFNSDADMIVSIHMNTHQDKSVNGPIVFFMPGSTKGKLLADTIQSTMNEELQPKSPKSAQSQNFLVLRSGNMPGVLVECGFITNKDEADKLSRNGYHKQVAQSITWGIMDYFSKES